MTRAKRATKHRPASACVSKSRVRGLLHGMMHWHLLHSIQRIPAHQAEGHKQAGRPGRAVHPAILMTSKSGVMQPRDAACQHPNLQPAMACGAACATLPYVWYEVGRIRESPTPSNATGPRRSSSQVLIKFPRQQSQQTRLQGQRAGCLQKQQLYGASSWLLPVAPLASRSSRQPKTRRACWQAPQQRSPSRIYYEE